MSAPATAARATADAVRLARADAARLARAGYYDSARRALDEFAGRDSTEVDALDLLARVHAQQGDLVAADKAWARVERLDPDHTGAHAGRRRIREIWSARRSRPGPRAGAALAALLLVGGGAAAGWSFAPRPVAADPSRDGEVLAELADLRGQVTGMREEIGDLRADGTHTADTATAERLRSVRAALDGPLWTVRPDGAALTLTFREAVFLAGGAEMSDDGRAALADVGRRLGRAGASSDLDVTVVGHTSDTAPVEGGPYADNAAVGLARALAAAEVVANGAALPLSSVDVATSGDVAPPYPNTDAAGRTRNQTVTLTIGVTEPAPR
jgi:flagellar motor protein MotB